MHRIFPRPVLGSIFIANLLVLISLPSSADQHTGMISAGKWIDRAVYGKTGKEIGEIDDLVVKRSGKVKKITIDVGGFIGIGEKLVAVSPEELQNLKMEGDGKLILDTTESQMEQRAEFDYYRNNLRPDYYYRPGHYRIYGYRAYPPPYMRYRPQGPQKQIEPFPEGKPYDWAFSPARYLASTLLGRQIIDENGVSIGRVADLLIDADDFKVVKIILTAEEIRGDDLRVEISFKPPGFTAYGLLMDITADKVRDLPVFQGQ